MHRVDEGLGAHLSWGSGGQQGVVAELAQGVEAALEQLAGQRETGAVAAQAFGGLVVVAAVGAAGAPRGLGRFEQRPAQRRRSLAGLICGAG